MRKLVIIALALVAGASLHTAQAETADGATKAPQKKAVAAKAGDDKGALASVADSVSYAAGMSMTNGLIPFIHQNMDVDTAFMADFIRGFEETVSKKDIEAMKAYAAGIQIANMLNSRMLPGIKKDFDGTQLNISDELFKQGFLASLKKDYSRWTDAAAEDFFKRRLDEAKAAKDEKLYGANRRAGEQFLAENAKKPGVKVLPSGLQYKELVKGTGDVASVSDEVTVKYEGKLIDGTVFDSSYERKEQTNKFFPSQVIKGWTEALTMMPAGSKWQIFIPYQLAYGSREAGKIKPYSALIFTVELVSVNKSAKK